jgi:hypothetical protein
VDLSRGVDLSPARPGLDAGEPPDRVDLDALDRRQVDDETVIDQGRARHVVAAAADRDRQPGLARVRESHSGIVGVGATGDQGRPPVDRGVP